MTRPQPELQPRPRPGPRRDDGATLVIVLVIVMVLAVSLSALLSFADTGERATVAMRSQAATQAEAEAAIDVAVNTLRRSTYDNNPGENCFGASNTLTLSNLAPAAAGGGGYDSAAVSCSPDPNSGAAGAPAYSSTNRPANAILTLGQNNPGEDGFVATLLNKPLQVRGSVVSDSTISVSHDTLQVSSGGVFATAGCTGAISPACQTRPAATDPGYASESLASLVNRTPTGCTQSGSLVTFTPGRYTSAAALNAMMSASSPCRNSVWWFTPGTYYFDFQDNNPSGKTTAHQWVVDSGTLVAGTPARGAARPSVPASVPGACASPLTSRTPGVQFVFGGDSQLQVGNAQAEICAGYNAAAPPIAVYGVRPQASLPAGVHAESGCVTQVGYGAPGHTKDTCAVLSTTQAPTNALYVQGTTYLPLGVVDLSLNQSSGQVLGAGVISRALRVTVIASSNFALPVIQLPADSSGNAAPSLLLSAYLCPGASSCAATGTAQLRAWVILDDPGNTPVAGQRQVTVKSWSRGP